MTRLTSSPPVALLGEAPPRVLVCPQGARSNSWQDVADLSAAAGVTLDRWQEVILEAAMGERTDRTWAAKRVGVTVPRQNGKSQLLVSRALAGALLFGEKKIVISAHQQDTAREAFSKLMEIVEADGNGWVRDRIRPGGIMQALNREAIKFTSGATIQFKARSGAGGKGFSSDCLMLDEAQILGQRAWVSINSTMSAMPNPQVWLLGTAPQDEDDSGVFEAFRAAAIGGTSTAAAWCEWGADPNAKGYDPASEHTRWTANPAWNTRINHEVVDGEFETYPPERFGPDRLGLWPNQAKARRFISADSWSKSAVDSAPDGVRCVGVAFSADGSRVSVAGAVRHSAGVYVELAGAHSGPTDAGVAQLASWLRDRWRTLAEVHICGAPGKTLYDSLTVGEGRVPARVVRMVTTADYLAACSTLVDSLRDGSLTHPKAPADDALDSSVAVCDRDKRGGWEATTDDGDETPLEAVSLALRAAKTTKRNPNRQSRAVVM